MAQKRRDQEPDNRPGWLKERTAQPAPTHGYDLPLTADLERHLSPSPETLAALADQERTYQQRGGNPDLFAPDWDAIHNTTQDPTLKDRGLLQEDHFAALKQNEASKSNRRPYEPPPEEWKSAPKRTPDPRLTEMEQSAITDAGDHAARLEQERLAGNGATDHDIEAALRTARIDAENKALAQIVAQHNQREPPDDSYIHNDDLMNQMKEREPMPAHASLTRDDLAAIAEASRQAEQREISRQRGLFGADARINWNMVEEAGERGYQAERNFRQGLVDAANQQNEHSRMSPSERDRATFYDHTTNQPGQPNPSNLPDDTLVKAFQEEVAKTQPNKAKGPTQREELTVLGDTPEEPLTPKSEPQKSGYGLRDKNPSPDMGTSSTSSPYFEATNEQRALAFASEEEAIAEETTRQANKNIDDVSAINRAADNAYDNTMDGLAATDRAQDDWNAMSADQQKEVMEGGQTSSPEASLQTLEPSITENTSSPDDPSSEVDRGGYATHNDTADTNEGLSMAHEEGANLSSAIEENNNVQVSEQSNDNNQGMDI